MLPIRRQSTLIAAFLTMVAATASVSARAGGGYVQTNLVSDISGMAELTDPNLQGAWGLSFPAAPSNGAFWISNAATDTSTLYAVSASTNTPSVIPLVVPIPNLNNAAPNQALNGPTGQVTPMAPGISGDPVNDFQVQSGATNDRAAFIFANADGSISAWRGGNAVIETSVAGASFTGLAIGNTSTGAAQLYAADQASGNIDIFNSKWQSVGTMIDPKFSMFPSGYAAFNVQNLSVNGTQTLFVTYANQSTGGGIVDEFTTNGTFIKTLIMDTAGNYLNAPWGLAIAPGNWGQFGGDLLVGNNNAGSNGLTEINAFNLTTGAYAGTITLANGQPFSETELWAISFGNGADAGSTNSLYFTAGLAGNADGLFGSISVPEPSSAVLGLIGAGLAAGRVLWKSRRRVRSVTAS